MFESNKAWGSKKPGPFLILSFLSFSLLSCSIYSNENNSTTNISNFSLKNETTTNTFTTNEFDDTFIVPKFQFGPFTDDVFNQSRFGQYGQIDSSNNICPTVQYILEGNNTTLSDCKYSNIFSYENDDEQNKLIKILSTNISKIANDKNESSFGLSDILGILGFIFGFVNFYYARYTDISKELDTYRREFWLKQVLFPGYIDNLKSLITDARACMEACNGSPVELSRDLLGHFNKVRDGSNFFNSYRNDFNAVIEQLIDDFDDKLADHAKANNNVIDASVLFTNLQSFVDEVFYMLDDIYSGEREKVPMFALKTIKRIFFVS